jgi:FMN phosphatase YigB (HAD superfamily)
LDGIIQSPEGLADKARALIFDLDGTLFDIRGFARHLVLARPGDVLIILAERLTRKGLRGRDFGSPGAYYEAFFSRMSRLTGASPETLRAWYFDRYMPRMGGILKKHYRPRPGTAELFNHLTGTSFPFAVYSDYPRTAERLSALGLEGGRPYGPELFGAQKPAARPFLSIAGDLGAPPDRTLVIGDRDDTDGAGALAAGMGYIGIGSPKKRKNSALPTLSWQACTVLLRERLRPGSGR